MAITSMTGYGKGEFRWEGGDFTVEIKSVNSRFLETNLRLPRELGAYEVEIRDLIAQTLKRGTVHVTTNLNLVQSAGQALQLNEGLFQQYLQIASNLENTHGLQGMSVADYFKIPDLLQISQKQGLNPDVWQGLKGAFADAIEQVKVMRQAEGANLAADLRARVEGMEEILSLVESVLPSRIGEYQDKLRQRLQALLGDVHLDENRLYQEVAIMADKMDVTEELVRFRSHNKLFVETLAGPGPHGKRLNFLLQEMGREANTLGTKSLFADMQHKAIQLKEDIEIIREQVQNLE